MGKRFGFTVMVSEFNFYFSRFEELFWGENIVFFWGRGILLYEVRLLGIGGYYKGEGI